MSKAILSTISTTRYCRLVFPDILHIKFEKYLYNLLQKQSKLNRMNHKQRIQFKVRVTMFTGCSRLLVLHENTNNTIVWERQICSGNNFFQTKFIKWNLLGMVHDLKYLPSIDFSVLRWGI